MLCACVAHVYMQNVNVHAGTSSTECVGTCALTNPLPCVPLSLYRLHNGGVVQRNIPAALVPAQFGFPVPVVTLGCATDTGFWAGLCTDKGAGIRVLHSQIKTDFVQKKHRS